MKRKILKRGKIINAKAQQVIDEMGRDMSSESRMAAIQMLIPFGLQAVERELQLEVRIGVYSCRIRCIPP